MKKILLPLCALAAGSINAFLSAGVHSLFFIVLPVLAFIFGYFSTWKRGLLYSLLLFAGYTLTISVFWWGIDSPNLLYPLPYFYSFITGGFGILLTGALAPMVRKNLKSAGAIAAFIILAGMAGWCGYSALPHYSYYYQVAVQSPENIENMEIYLPLGNVSGAPYEELYSHVLEMPGDLTENFSREIVNTEYGTMLKITVPELKKDDVPVPRYTANIIWQSTAPRELIRLMPKYDVEQTGTVTSLRAVGPVKSHESLDVERFRVPVKITAGTQAPVNLTLWNRTDRAEAINFGYYKSYPYTERIDNGNVEAVTYNLLASGDREIYNLTTGNEWVLVPVEATIVTNIRGISD